MGNIILHWIFGIFNIKYFKDLLYDLSVQKYLSKHLRTELLFQGLNSKVRQEQHFKCPGAKGFDPCKEPPFRITFDVPKLCGSDNVTHSNIWDMACIAINYRVRKYNLSHLHNILEL